MEKMYQGSCHCAAIQFQAEIDLQAGTNKCNCSICTKTRSWGAIIKPEKFKLLRSEDAMQAYRFNTMTGRHVFCRDCGIQVFCDGHLEELGGDYVVIHLNVLDDLSPEELLSAPVTYIDGRHDNWWQAPAEIRHL